MAPQIETSTEALEVIADRFAEAIAPTAVERDHLGGTAKVERDALRRTGLLNLLIPEYWGGHGASWPLI